MKYRLGDRLILRADPKRIGLPTSVPIAVRVTRVSGGGYYDVRADDGREFTGVQETDLALA